jgi:hypothetical protein
MGKPIQKKWFGKTTLSGNQIVVTGIKFKDGTTATDGYIVKQTGSDAYIVRDSSDAHAAERVFMVNATSLGGLTAGQCFINATAFGGSARPCKKIAQFRLDLFEADGSIKSYSWSRIPATAAGQADLISGSGLAGRILSVAVNVGGGGYFTAPAITFNGGGVGATAHTVLTNGAVSSIVVDTAGANYTNGSTTIVAPPAVITGTATATVNAGAVNSVTVNTAGGYYTSPPTVTFGGPGTGASATAVLTNGAVTSFTSLVGGTGYSSAPVVTLSAPTASVQATATATISV